ncbi:DUF1835 domain-containing protein [Paenibacillus sp. 481]|uniref:DUF1835 domain-containing protein n=1 Tax=Paenibacillus sp. 481 TaxID=2835869 RepID=UPI001E549556|nr:DUF1835 domain-containing protein [Paenibacillus sp. 481]UHA73212.1 DUF1835 domain-containing protein [Paenibacillus sp. 481]
MNRVHIAFGDSAYGNSKFGLSKSEKHQNEQIIGVKDDFSIGPIYELDSEAGSQARNEWIKEVLIATEADVDGEYLSWLDTMLESHNLQTVRQICLAGK